MSNLPERKLLVRNRDEFLKFLDALSKINESCILKIQHDNISSLIASTDGTLILHATYSTECSFEDTINIPDIKKLVRVIDTINSKEIEFDINSNNIEYKGNGIKFKYHLFDEGFLTAPNINLDKIKSFGYDVSFELTKEILTQVFKGSTFASNTNKIYFYTEDNQLMAELTDRARHNTDNFTLSVGPADYNLSPTPINFDNIRLLTNVNNVFDVNINTEYGVADPRRWTVLIDPSGSSVYITCFENKPFLGEYLFAFDDGNVNFRPGFSLKTDSIEVVVNRLLANGVSQREQSSTQD